MLCVCAKQRLGSCTQTVLLLSLCYSLYHVLSHPQVGTNQFFDLVYYDKLDASRTFRVRKLTQFEDFKQQVRGVGAHGAAGSDCFWFVRV